MHSLRLFILFLILFPLAAAQNYRIDRYIIGSGGGESQSANYQVNGTIGQPIIGASSSANYVVEAGFWVGSGLAQSGYEYLPGDANMYNGAWPPAVIGSDVTYLVNYFRGLPTNPACLIESLYASADVNASCNVIGSDVTRLVSYFRGQAVIEYCPDWEPAWHNTGELPAEAPAGWPNCEGGVTGGDDIKGESGLK